MSYRDEEVARLHARVNELEQKISDGVVKVSRPPWWWHVVVGAVIFSSLTVVQAIVRAWAARETDRMPVSAPAAKKCVFDYCYPLFADGSGVFLMGHVPWYVSDFDKQLSGHKTLSEAIEAARLLNCPMMVKP